MKTILIHIILLTAVLFLHGNCYAETDSIPACINTIKISTKRSVTEYQYKGQRWFVLTKIVPPPAPNNSDKMTIINFYNDSCKIVCSWKKGGIAGLNNVFPDTIQKEKITLVNPIPVEINKVSDKKTNLLPDSITKLATLKNSKWIEENNYPGRSLYRFQNPSDNPSTSKITFAGLYYDENGKATSPGNLTGKTWWWHNVNGKFIKTQFRPGYR